MIRRLLVIALLCIAAATLGGCKNTTAGVGADGASSAPKSSAATTADPAKKVSDIDVTGPIGSGGIVNNEVMLGIAMPATVDGVASSTVIPSFVITSTTEIDQSGKKLTFSGGTALFDKLGGLALSVHGALKDGRWVATTIKAVPVASVDVEAVEVSGVIQPAADGAVRVDGRTAGSDPSGGVTGTFLVETEGAFAGVPAGVQLPIAYNASTVLVSAEGKEKTLGEIFKAKPSTAIGVILPPKITVKAKKDGARLIALRIQTNY